MEAFDFDAVMAQLFAECRTIFTAKLEDYGPTWMIFRDESLVDQLWIKARRIRTLEESGDNLVGEGRDSEFIGLINYAVIMLMRIRFPERYPSPDAVMRDLTLLHTLSPAEISADYGAVLDEARTLLGRKNHDYGGAWMEMLPCSITDQILIKLLRIKNIEEQNGRLLVSEGIDAQLTDVINYSLFGLIMARGYLKKEDRVPTSD